MTGGAQSVLSDVGAVIERGSRRSAAPPRRGAAPCRLLPTACHPARVACGPEGIRRASPGALAQEEPTIPTSEIGQGFGCPRAAARVHRARSSRPLVLQGRRERGSADRSKRSCGVRQVSFLGPSICTTSPNSRYLTFYGLQRPGRRPSMLTVPTTLTGPHPTGHPPEAMTQPASTAWRQGAIGSRGSIGATGPDCPWIWGSGALGGWGLVPGREVLDDGGSICVHDGPPSLTPGRNNALPRAGRCRSRSCPGRAPRGARRARPRAGLRPSGRRARSRSPRTA